MSKVDELRRRVGNSELHFCGKQKKQTEHIWIEEDRTEVGWINKNYSAFCMKCKECGHYEVIYTNRPV